MLTLTERDQDFLQNLNRHPLLRARMESLLNVVENTAGDLDKADDAESRVIDELRKMGNEALTSWAERSVSKIPIETKSNSNLRPAGKKLYWHTTFGKVEVLEPLWRDGDQTKRYFSLRAEVVCRGNSQPLQRVITDLWVDNAFGRVPSKLKDHYGIEMPVTTIQRVTEHHAQRCYKEESARPVTKKGAGCGTFIGEMDGSMVPVVEISHTAKDKRSEKKLVWKEVRLCLVHKEGEVTPRFGGHLFGGVEECGRQWEQCAARAGFGVRSHL